MATIFHLAFAADWAAAQASGSYTISTRGRTLAEEGFLHAARADQWTGVRDSFYADATEPLVLLQIDTDRLDVPVVEEPPAPGVTETFPHIYGPLRVDAVVRALPLPAATPGPTADAAPATAEPRRPEPTPDRPAATAAPHPAASFSALYFREMFANALLVLVAIALGFTGILLGSAVEEDLGPGIGGIIGTTLGVVAAVLLYRRRQRGR